MSSRRNKRRRSQKEWRDVHEVPILRLVRPEDAGVPAEPVSPGLPDTPVAGVPEADRTNGSGGTATGESLLVASIDGEPDAVAQINPVAIEPGYYLVEFDGISKLPHLNAYRVMFTQTDCLGLLAKIPMNGEEAALATLLGWTHQFDSRGIGHWELCYNDWIRNTPELMQVGVNFINRLELEFMRHGHTQKIETEPSYLLHIGALAAMLYTDQMDKAVALYNGWARFADYPQIELKSHSPALLDIGNALLQMTGDSFKVIKINDAKDTVWK